MEVRTCREAALPALLIRPDYENFLRTSPISAGRMPRKPYHHGREAGGRGMMTDVYFVLVLLSVILIAHFTSHLFTSSFIRFGVNYSYSLLLLLISLPISSHLPLFVSVSIILIRYSYYLFPFRSLHIFLYSFRCQLFLFVTLITYFPSDLFTSLKFHSYPVLLYGDSRFGVKYPLFFTYFHTLCIFSV